MNDALLLQPIDSRLTQVLGVDLRDQFAGRVQQIYDPQARRPALMRFDESGKPARFTIDTVKYDIQVAHRLTGGQPIKNPSTYGSRQKIAFDLSWTMIVATKQLNILSSFLLAFSSIPDVEVSEFNTDTLRVLKNEFLFAPDAKSPYDPLLQCFSIQYRMLNISDKVFSTLCNSFSQHD